MKKLLSVGLLSIAALVVWALPSNKTGDVGVTWPRALSVDYPDETYFAGSVVYVSTNVNFTLTGTAYPVTGAVFTNHIFGLTRGATYFFTATQVGTNGLESDFGNIVSWKVPNKPGATSISLSP